MSETQNMEVSTDDFSPVKTRSSPAKEKGKVNEDATTANERNDEEQSKTSEEIDNENLPNSEVCSVTKSKGLRKSEAELRAKEVQLENERRIKEQQQVDLANAELEAEQSMSESDDNSSRESTEREKSQHKSVLENLPKEKQEDSVQRFLSDVERVEKPGDNAKQGQIARHEKLQQTGEPNHLQLGTEIAKQTKPSVGR